MTQINRPPAQGVLMKWWTRLEPLPGGRLLFSLLLGRLAPYTGSLGARIEQLKPGFARVTLRDRRRLRNHLSSLHAIALINLGELATGLAVLSTIPANMRGILLDIHADYLKKARGKLTATANFEMPAAVQDETACAVEAELQDQSGDIVTRVRATWLIGMKPDVA